MTDRMESVELAEVIEESYSGNFIEDILLNEHERRIIVAALRASPAGGESAAVEFVKWALREGPWEGADLDGGSIQDKAESLGLIVKATFDSKKHGGADFSDGDNYYEFSPALATLPAAAQSAACTCDWATGECQGPVGCKAVKQASGDAWKDDPASDERWNAGCDFAMLRLCEFLSVDPALVRWDAATETVEGDVSAVIGNILRGKFGEDWGPNDVTLRAQLEATRKALQALWVCSGCGSRESIDQIRGEHPGAISCCPERKMGPAAALEGSQS